MKLEDFGIRLLAEVLFRAIIFGIERVGTSDFVQDVVHNLKVRHDRRGIYAALSSASRAILRAAQSRISVSFSALSFPTIAMAEHGPLLFYFTFLYVALTSLPAIAATIVAHIGRPSLLAIALCIPITVAAFMVMSCLMRRVLMRMHDFSKPARVIIGYLSLAFALYRLTIAHQVTSFNNLRDVGTALLAGTIAAAIDYHLQSEIGKWQHNRVQMGYWQRPRGGWH